MLAAASLLAVVGGGRTVPAGTYTLRLRGRAVGGLCGGSGRFVLPTLSHVELGL